VTTTLASTLSVFSNWLPSTDRWFKPLDVLGRSLSPVVQGGMGVGVSAHRLAAAVAHENAMGTIASIDLRHHHPDLLEQTEKSRDRDLIDRVNLIALDREVRAALRHSEGKGLIAVNVMKAVRDHAALVRQACESGAHAIVMGAGLPMRAVSTHWLRQYQRQESKMQASAKADPRRCSQRMDCLTQCGLRDGNSKAGQFCIDLKLAAALKGDVQKGLFFRGAGRLPFGEAIRPVKDLIEYLLHGHPCQASATQEPDLPPCFSNSLTPSITMPRSMALSMS